MSTKHKPETGEARKLEEAAGQTHEQTDTAVNVENDNSSGEVLTEAEKSTEKKSDALVEQYKEKWLRLNAEFENYKKRTLREKSELIKTAGQEVIISLLPVLDDFERALKNAGPDDKTQEGIRLIYQKLKNMLEQKGLKPMEATGEDFDTDLHEAITSVKAEEEMKGKVVEEMEKGYFLNGKVIRHAKVIVGE
jgi:molecular chaperone GrpE